ncbi:hypothetical protein IFM89_007980 [Coptis chinensis]|uniref:Uncharacterized protein n=1 Tax=Coptis chinensis TaxID=261450 RepID=A0A835MAC6_9MAGN|nr:hypothetical protein IFM89_007980 [Coptis chinensis]
MDGCGGDENKWSDHNSDGEDEEETLSLCDLPVCVNNEENRQSAAEETKSLEAEDFAFGSLSGSRLTESEMCAADQVFFQGQLLPLRLSVSSEAGLPCTKEESKNLNRCESRAESMDHNSSCGFTSHSSRSNSTGSHNSTITTSSTTSTYKPKLRNQFHSHPSPNPQILHSGAKPGNACNRSRNSTIWGIFRLGLVKTPEIELQELKLRNNNKKKTSFNSRSSSSSSSRKSDSEVKLEKKKKAERYYFENCKCSVNAVETVIVIKKKKNVYNERERKEEVKEKEKTEKEKKQELYHRRTFEWLKELSIADVPTELRRSLFELHVPPSEFDYMSVLNIGGLQIGKEISFFNSPTEFFDKKDQPQYLPRLQASRKLTLDVEVHNVCKEIPSNVTGQRCNLITDCS